MPTLEDPEYAAFAWGRYWLIMRWMGLVAILSIVATLGLIWYLNGSLSISLAIGIMAGIGGTVLLTAALMGLLFLSSGTGHDEQVHDPLKGEVDIDD